MSTIVVTISLTTNVILIGILWYLAHKAERLLSRADGLIERIVRDGGELARRLERKL